MKLSGKIIFSLVFIGLSVPVYADAEFGRLYTTPSQRLKLDELRNKQPTEPIVIDLSGQEISETESVVEAPVLIDAITLNGLVYRRDGKSTAWINGNSTTSGNIETQFTTVRETDVRSNQVQITLPDNRSNIQLKVGQQYDVRSHQVYDVVNDPVTSSPALSPGESRQLR